MSVRGFIQATGFKGETELGDTLLEVQLTDADEVLVEFEDYRIYVSASELLQALGHVLAGDWPKALP